FDGDRSTGQLQEEQQQKDEPLILYYFSWVAKWINSNTCTSEGRETSDSEKEMEKLEQDAPTSASINNVIRGSERTPVHAMI
ncbi:hypothetical protein PRIPAC_87296, partial [Pristionchus pacificus]|uniref:Uncharacterized protein n=1 Tax=Pristionchus pacificus TaxID=54126 RepID=A0A2A6CTI8_PRIPA